MSEAALRYFENDELPANVWETKYGLRDADDNLIEQTPDDTHRRLAREFARIEAGKFQQPYSEEYIYSLLKDFGPIIPQGSPMSGIGSKQFVSLSNCYVVDPPLDSYGGICHTDQQLVQICKRRGGVGTDLSYIRPAEMPTTNSARRATGVVTFAERFSNSIREVGQNGRRGALMLTLSVHHPEVVGFARMKLDRTKVTGANVSVRLTDEFLQAVQDDAEYEQRWPVASRTPLFSRKVKAREVWKQIIHCAWQRAEPGLLFWDNIIRESPADCYASLGFQTVATNPCAELPLCVLDSCRLLLLNLFCFVRYPFTPSAYFDFNAFYEHAQVAQRLMDDLVDLELEFVDRILTKIKADPEPDHIKQCELDIWTRVREKCANGRRTGTGITALGDAMAATGVAYGSDKSIDFVDMVYRVLKLGSYRSSVDMARELGPFPVWNAELEKDCPFLLRIKNEDSNLYADMQVHGRRNIALLTTAPAGTVSILAGLRPYFGTTSGIEPLFTDEPYIRRKKINHADKDARVDSVDDKGDRWTHYPVYHAKLKQWMDVTGETDIAKSPYHGCCAKDLDWKQRVRLQATAQKHVDHAISSTINLPADVTEEQVAEVYEALWKEGCKGGTVYRDGCRDGVLVTAETSSVIHKTQAPKRPKELPCDIHHMVVDKKPCVVVVGLLKDEPYEVFAFTNTMMHITCDDGLLLGKSHQKGVIKKVKRGEYMLLAEDGTDLLHNCSSLNGLLSTEEAALTRMLSTSLRHGVDISFILDQLGKVEGDLHCFTKAVARALKKYVPDGKKVSGTKCPQCGEESLRYQEGCQTCGACGFSKCS